MSGLKRYHRHGELPAHGLALRCAASTTPYDEDVDFHDHDFIEVTVIFGGRAEHLTLHGSETITAGDVLVSPPRCWHALRRCRGLALANLMFGPELLVEELAWISADPRVGGLLLAGGGCRTVRPSAAIAAHLHTETRRLLQLNDGTERLERLARLATVLALLAPLVPVSATILPAHDAKVAALLRTLAGDLARAWSLDECAAHVGVTPSQCRRRFGRLTGQAPIAWLNRRRAEAMAADLLVSGCTVQVAAARVGWSDASYAARRFREVFASSPADYVAGRITPRRPARRSSPPPSAEANGSRRN